MEGTRSHPGGGCTWFCGSCYERGGSHEDALRTGLHVAHCSESTCHGDQTAAFQRFPTLDFGHVVHQRLRPVVPRFRYQVCGLLIDLDELTDSNCRLALFSVNRWNVFGFSERDPHGQSLYTDRPSGAGIHRHLSRHSIDAADRRVPLLRFPRLFGYAFNPLTVWSRRTRSGDVAAVVS